MKGRKSYKITSNDLEMTLGDLEMTLRPLTTVPLARTSKMLQKLSNIRVCSSYSTSFIKENPYSTLFLGEVVHKTGLYIYERAFSQIWHVAYLLEHRKLFK